MPQYRNALPRTNTAPDRRIRHGLDVPAVPSPARPCQQPAHLRAPRRPVDRAAEIADGRLGLAEEHQVVWLLARFTRKPTARRSPRTALKCHACFVAWSPSSECTAIRSWTTGSVDPYRTARRNARSARLACPASTGRPARCAHRRNGAGRAGSPTRTPTSPCGGRRWRAQSVPPASGPARCRAFAPVPHDKCCPGKCASPALRAASPRRRDRAADSVRWSTTPSIKTKGPGGSGDCVCWRRFPADVSVTAVTTGRQAPQPGRPDPVPIVQVDGVSKSFAGVAALRGLSLTVRSGEYLTVVADTGCGKSTLLRVIEGLTAPRWRPHRCRRSRHACRRRHRRTQAELGRI